MKIQKKYLLYQLLQDTFDEFFTGKSAAEKGTLYHLKNLLNQRSVKRDIGKCFNHAAEFLDFTTEILLVLLALETLKMENIESIPKDGPKPSDSREIKQDYLDKVSSEIVDAIWHETDTKTLLKEIEKETSEITERKICYCRQGAKLCLHLDFMYKFLNAILKNLNIKSEVPYVYS